MTRPLPSLLFTATLAFGVPAAAAAQENADRGTRLEAVVTVGWGRLWQWESNQPKRAGINVGGALILHGDSGLALSLGADRTFGIAAAPLAFSANLRYYFRSDERVQPYVIVGLGALRLDRRALPLAGARSRPIVYGFGPNLGAGVAIATGNVVGVAPEFQWLEGGWRSPLNMSITRVAGGIGLAGS